MTAIGYALSSEEHGPDDLVRYARRAEESGFSFALISDHFHPWTNRQGHSPFVWSVLGAIARETRSITVGTGVTCPTIRMHPAIVAHAAATMGSLMPGRFFLGVGSGENLNEHVVGAGWPDAEIRVAMLEEAIQAIKTLLAGGEQTHRGPFFTIEDARLYDVPEEGVPVVVAAWGDTMVQIAGRDGDGLISTSPKRDLIQRFEDAGGAGKPRYGQITVCWAEDEQEARRTALEWWPNTGLGSFKNELPTPAMMEQACALVREEDITSSIVCGPDPQRHLDGIHAFIDAGYDHVYVHQVGPDQEGFFRFYEREIIPAIAGRKEAGAA